MAPSEDENFNTGQIVITVMNVTVNEWKGFIGLRQAMSTLYKILTKIRYSH